MNLCKQAAVALLLAVSTVMAAYADTLADYQAASDNYLEATACMAAYSNDYGAIAMAALQQDGWKIQYFDVKQATADAKFILMKRRDSGTGQVRYLLAVAGTETDKDIRADLRFGKVYFAGKTTDEFAANAEKQVADDSLPKVHRGFHQVVQAICSADLREGGGQEHVSDLLVMHPEQKLILTGHSLGGAAAVLYGARLLSMGIRPEQIQVVTFGAPAVGNAAFARLLEDKLNVTRFVTDGDQITSVLQDMVGGYVQYGGMVRLQPPEENVLHPHYMAVYMDGVTTRYLESRRKAVAEGLSSLPRRAVAGQGPPVYIAAVKNSLPQELSGEFINMRTLLEDEYRHTLSGYIMGEEESLTGALKHASALGCQQLVAAEIGGMKLKKSKTDRYYINLQQQVFSVPDGRLLDTRNISVSTAQLTPLVALVYDIGQLSLRQQSCLLGRN